MCCFSQPAEVHGTQIFARFLRPDHSVQALAYQMSYAAAGPGATPHTGPQAPPIGDAGASGAGAAGGALAMILPLPVSLPAREDSVKFINLKAFPELLDNLVTGFPEPESFSLSRSKSATASAMPEAQLVVHEVGDFIASFVPSQDDFKRLDPRFVISKDVWAKIPTYRDYGFAVFQLKAPSGRTHPMALEFETRMRGHLFFPTVHIHDGSVHAKDHFDHVLYLQDATFDAAVGKYEGPTTLDARTRMVRSKEKAQTFASPERSSGIIDGNLLVHRLIMTGELPNTDTTFDLNAVSERAKAGCSRCDSTGDAITMGNGTTLSLATLVGWVVRRRRKVGGL